MPKGLALEILEAVGAALVAVGLALWSLPFGLVAAGLFLILLASSVATPSRVGTGRRR